MRLHEIELPTKAGIATIKWVSYGKTPSIRDQEIRLPSEVNNEFFALDGGNKFLFVNDGPDPREFWFGGTDAKSVFLVEVTEEAFEAFVDKGENGFFDHLKPDKIKELERVWKTQAGRQGDIWYLKVSLSWTKFDSLVGLIDSESSESGIVTGPVFGTRHTLTGRCIERDDLVIGSGVLEAPNHPTVKLNGPHVLMQNDGLQEPESAD